MAAFTARMVHPQGPHPFPSNPAEDRDSSRDPRSVMVWADDVEQAREVLQRDNPEFEFLDGPNEMEQP